MKMELTTIVGIFAAVFTTTAFLPQAIKTIKSKNTRDISLPMYLLFTSGLSLWLMYGILLQNAPIIISNAITVILAGIILSLKLKYK